jgi:hypothetical protein
MFTIMANRAAVIILKKSIHENLISKSLLTKDKPVDEVERFSKETKCTLDL